MNLKEQTYICTLARCGTISKAAEELHLTAPALSMFLSTLEKNLGVKLFHRTAKTLEPTPIGREYIRIAGQMLQLKDQFDRLLARETCREKPLLRIGIQQRRAITAIPRLMPLLKQVTPEIDVVFRDDVYTGLIKQFEQRQLDYLFYTLESPLPGAEYTVMRQEPVLAVIPLDSPCCRHIVETDDLEYPWIAPSALGGQTLILPQKSQSLRLAVDRILEEAGVFVRNILEIGHISTIVEMTSLGMGVGFTRLAYLKNMRRPENVCFCFLGRERAGSPLVLMYPPEKAKAPYHAALVEAFREISATDGAYTDIQ